MTTTTEHDSDNCVLGPNDTPCDMCVAADEYEAREARKVSRAVQETENVSTASRDAGIGLSGRGRGSLWANAATIRAAIADTLDRGQPYTSGGYKGWMSWEFDIFDESQNETDHRQGFADAVLRRIAELQSPPHNAPRLEQRCDSHKRRLLPAYSGECVECAREMVTDVDTAFLPQERVAKKGRVGQ